MSNLAQFVGKNYPVGFILSTAYQGSTITTEDGTIWICHNNISMTPYNSSLHADVSDYFKTPHGVLNSWNSNGFFPASTNIFLSYDRIGNVWLASGWQNNLNGDSTNGFMYFRSADGGANWTQYTWPNTKIYVAKYIESCSRWIAYSNTGTTNGALWSTDGITWNAVTAVSIGSNPYDIAGIGTNQAVVIGPGVAMYTLDAGATWASTALSAGTPNSNRSSFGSYNAGAGLFVYPASASTNAGAYYTTPTGQTWTLRTPASFTPYGANFFGTSGGPFKFISNATTTVAVGYSGFFCTSTDCLTWSNHGFIAEDIYSTTTPSVMWNGTYFVVVFRDRVFYSSNGTSWTEGKRFLPGSDASLDEATNRRIVRMAGFSSQGLSRVMVLEDPSLTAPAYISPATVVGSFNAEATYVRIK